MADESTPLYNEEALLGGRRLSRPKEIFVDELGEHYGIRHFHVIFFFVMLVAQLPAAAVMSTAPFMVDEIKQEFQVSNELASLIVSSVMLGSVPGVLCCGFLGDRFGRRACIAGMIIAISLGGLLHLAIPRGANGQLGFTMLISIRVLLGLPYGGLINLFTPFCIEFVTNDVRGFAATSINLAWPIGSIYSIACVQAFGVANWRVCLAVTPLPPALLSLLCLAYIPESPRWLRVSGYVEEAQTALDQIFASPPLVGNCYVGEAPAVIVRSEPGASKPRLEDVLSEVLSPALRRVTLLATCIYCLVAGTSNAIFAWGPILLKAITRAEIDLEIFQQAELFSLLGTLVCMVCIDVVGRRALLCLGFLGSGIITVVWLRELSLDTLIALWWGRALFDSILLSVVGAYVGEVFPTALRGSASGFVMLWGRVFSVLFPMVVGALLPDISTILVCLSSLFFLGAALALMMPELARCSIQDQRESTFQGACSTERIQ